MARKLIHSERLCVLGTTTPITSYTVLTSSTVSTNPVNVSASDVVAAVLITITTNSAVSINCQVSDDGINFYTPVNTSLTSLGSIVSSITSTAASIGRWVVFSPQLARQMRFAISGESSYSSVTMDYIQQEQT